MTEVPDAAVRRDLLHPAIARHAEKGPWPDAAGLIGRGLFRDALRSYCATMLQPHAAGWPADKFFGQKLRYLVCFVLIGLDARWRRGAGEAPTLSTLQRVAPASGRQVAALITAMKLGGYVVASPLPEDRRALRLSPTMALLAEIGRSPLAFLAASERLEPASQTMTARLGSDAVFAGDWLGTSYDAFLEEDIYFGPFANIVRLTGQYCGFPVLSAVLGAHYAALADVPAPALLSYGSLAERFRVSRQHVGNILGDAELNGCFSVDRGGQRVSIAPDFLWEFESWAAGQMAHYRRLAERVLAQAGASGPAARAAAGATPPGGL